MRRVCPRRAGWIVGLAVGLCTSSLGCHLFPLLPRHDGPPDRPEPELLAGFPTRHSFRVSQFVFVPDFEVRRDLPIFKELTGLREQVFKELKLPPTNTEIYVYLFEHQQSYERFMAVKYPDLPKRRAFFVAQPRRLGGTEDLLVYTYWGDRISQDLRHELTHALLHSVLKDVPLWLDEGLAEYFEVPATWNGVNAQHVDGLRQAQGVSLDRLEQLQDVQQMTPAEYREAWAWVHFMLKGNPVARQVLLAYLHELRSNPLPGPLRPRLAPAALSLDDAMRKHLTEIDARARGQSAQR